MPPSVQSLVIPLLKANRLSARTALPSPAAKLLRLANSRAGPIQQSVRFLSLVRVGSLVWGLAFLDQAVQKFSRGFGLGWFQMSS